MMVVDIDILVAENYGGYIIWKETSMKVDMSSTQISYTDARSHEKIKLSSLVKLSFSVVAKMNNG